MRLPAIKRRTLLQMAAATGAMAALPKFAFANQSTTLVVAHTGVAPSLDSEKDFTAPSQDIYPALYDTLVAFDTVPDGRFPDILREDTSYHADKQGGLALKGKLAESWELNPDGTKITFKLREGVKSQYGNTLSAEDVRWTWDRRLNFGGSGKFFCSLLQITNIDQVKVESENAVSFNLPKPNPLILKLHTNNHSAIFDSIKMKEAATADDPWASKFLQNNSAGYGAYAIRELNRGQQLVLTSRPDYWGKKPFFDTVVVREVPSSASRLSLLQGGAVDMAFYLSPREADSLRKAGNVSISDLDSSFMMWMHMNTLFKPFDNKLVRQAMNYLIPQDEIVKSVFYGMASPQRAPFPRIYPMVDEEFYSYSPNVEKAKKLLAEAGYPNGFDTSITFDAQDPVEESIALIIQTTAKQAGINITLDKLPTGVYWEQMSGRKKPLSLWRDMPMTPDPNYAATLYFTKKSFVNFNGWWSQGTEDLIAAARNEFNDAKRTEIYRKIQKMIMDDAPWGFIVYPNWILARKREIKGFVQYSANAVNFGDLRREA